MNHARAGEGGEGECAQESEPTQEENRLSFCSWKHWAVNGQSKTVLPALPAKGETK